MKNENMAAYNMARQELDALLNRVNAIIMQSAQGEDPDTTDYQESLRRQLRLLRRLPLIRRIIKQRGKQPLPAP